MKASNILAPLLFSTLASTFVAAQDFTITDITVPGAGVRAFTVGDYFASYAHYTATSFRFSEHRSSFELLAGPKESTTNDVLDVMCVNEDVAVITCNYYFSRSIPAGSYHFRVNVTNTTTSSSVLSDTFNVAAFVPECTAPPPWNHITSTSDANYTSLQFVLPSAGSVDRLSPNGRLDVVWRFRDGRNEFSAGINNVTLDFVNAKSGRATGNYVWKTTDNPTAVLPYASNGVTAGSWRLRANYSSIVEGSPLGSTITTLGEVFFVESDQGHCDGIDDGDTGQGSGSGQGGGSGQGTGQGGGGGSGQPSSSGQGAGSGNTSGTERTWISGVSWITVITFAAFITIS